MASTLPPKSDSPSLSHEIDYPAAHSMDSTWFAIDKNGFVAQFDTGEAGAVPENASIGQGIDSFEEQLRQAGIRGEIIFDFQGRRRPGMQEVRSIFGGPGVGELSLVFARSLDLIQDALRDGRAQVVRAVSDFAVIWRDMTQAEYDRLDTSGELIGVEYYYRYQGMPDSLAQSGVYVYGHTCENWIAGPYGREEVPSIPLHVDQLPPPIRADLKRCRFESISFADTVHLQPAELLSCVAWDQCYLGMDGKRYSMNGDLLGDDENPDGIEE